MVIFLLKIENVCLKELTNQINVEPVKNMAL